ncbi:erythromycin esterase family protein [Photobacterium angustum]|uniref:Erythromycin esterase n=1 Tax=Photobacterium angustum TaxID=661 RepID=A0A2S7VL18_PHOAN|nr:erythromycin esterase family protein [Photobacterium angustum]PQJ62846.1 hypothetical protein BTO08_21800 [Photobacterium angustum]
MHKYGWLIAFLLAGCNSSSSDQNPLPVSYQSLKTTDFNEDTSDLSSFVSTVKGYDMVGLGESSHQGKKTFSYRARMLKALHEQGDLDFIAMESGLYDGLTAWHNYLTGKQSFIDAVTGPDANYLFMYRLSADLAPLFNYVNNVDQNDNPLLLVAYDARINSDPGCSVMFDELEMYLTEQHLLLDEFATIKAISPRMMCPWSFEQKYVQSDHDLLISALVKLETLLAQQKQHEIVPLYEHQNPRDFRHYASFWLQIAKSLQAHANTNLNNLNHVYADFQSADNIRWLREEWFNVKGQTAVWGHNIHATPLDNSVIDATQTRYPDVSIYSVMDITHSGYRAPFTSDTTKWATDVENIVTTKGTVNHRLFESGLPDSFIDLTGLNNDEKVYFESIQKITPYTGKLQVAAPSSLMDGILFIPVEEPTVAR